MMNDILCCVTEMWSVTNRKLTERYEENMTGEQFVKLCYDEKETILSEYFRDGSQTIVAEKLRSLFEKGIEKDELYELLNLVLNENYYTLLLGLDGEAALGNVQNAYKLYDEDGNLLNECGEIEEAAYRYFMEK